MNSFRDAPLQFRADETRTGGALALLTLPQLCERWQVKPSWVYEAKRSKGLPALKLGNHLRFDPAAIDCWLAEHCMNDD